MSRDTTLTDPDGGKWSLDNLSTQRWLEGHESGASAFAAWLHEHAIALIRDGKDEQAAMVRDLAKKGAAAVAPKLREAAAQHERQFPIHPEEEGGSS